MSKNQRTCFLRALFFSYCFLGSLSLAVASPLVPRQPARCPEFPHLFPQEGPLALLNCDMHQAYEKRVAELVASFGALPGRPIILNLGGALILKHAGNTTTANLTPLEFHAIKAYCHEALALFLILSAQQEGALTAASQSALKRSLVHLQASKALLHTFPLETAALLRSLVSLCEFYIDKRLFYSSWQQRELATFYKSTAKILQKLIERTAQIEIASLDQAVLPWLATIPAELKPHIGIVVATVHQARAQEISVQYFAKMFQKRLGVGALGEDGMVVLENNFSEDFALKMLARHYLDRELSQALFNKPERMQEDLLSESARKILAGRRPLAL